MTYLLLRLRLPVAGALLLTLLSLLSGPALADKADRNKPMNVEADAGRYDDLKQIGVFSGNVVVTKGTIVMRAGQIEIHQTPEGHQRGVATAAAGKLVTFKQKREGVDETIEGEAERIEYDSRTDTVKLINRAIIRRFRGATLADETTGSLISYDNIAESFSVSGGGSTSTGTQSGRVRAVLTPREKAPAEAASASPAKSESGDRR